MDDETGIDADRAAVEGLVQTFFAAVVTGPELDGRLDALRAVLLPGAVIVRTSGLEPAVYDVESFIGPRRELLSGGRLTGCREWAVSGRTELFGDIGQHFCRYAKSWVEDGVPVRGGGMKTFQFV